MLIEDSICICCITILLLNHSWLDKKSTFWLIARKWSKFSLQSEGFLTFFVFYVASDLIVEKRNFKKCRNLSCFSIFLWTFRVIESWPFAQSATDVCNCSKQLRQCGQVVPPHTYWSCSTVMSSHRGSEPSDRRPCLVSLLAVAESSAWHRRVCSSDYESYCLALFL